MSDSLSCSILIFEDDPQILTMLATFFAEKGATVSTAEDGRDALARIKSVHPDIILLDVVMPVQDGLSILQELRRVDQNVPVILLTEKSTVDDKVTGLEFGADDYMPKPFSIKELLARVRAQLRRLQRKQPAETACIKVGKVRIDPMTREIYLPKDKTLPLTKTEFDLLAFLAARVGTVVPHGVLLQDVLGYDPGVETKTLIMHLANIRRKIEKVCPQALTIKSVTGIGYKLLPGPPK